MQTSTKQIIIDCLDAIIPLFSRGYWYEFIKEWAVKVAKRYEVRVD